MHERKIEEDALGRRDLEIKAPGNGAIGRRTGKQVSRKSRWTAAEHVAGKLIEHDQKSKRSLRVIIPTGKQAVGCRRVKRSEFVADFSVGVVALGKPSVRTERAPIGKHVGDGWQRRIGRSIARNHNLMSPATIRR